MQMDWKKLLLNIFGKIHDIKIFNVLIIFYFKKLVFNKYKKLKHFLSISK